MLLPELHEWFYAKTLDFCRVHVGFFTFTIKLEWKIPFCCLSLSLTLTLYHPITSHYRRDSWITSQQAVLTIGLTSSITQILSWSKTPCRAWALGASVKLVILLIRYVILYETLRHIWNQNDTWHYDVVSGLTSYWLGCLIWWNRLNIFRINRGTTKSFNHTMNKEQDERWRQFGPAVDFSATGSLQWVHLAHPQVSMIQHKEKTVCGIK